MKKQNVAGEDGPERGVAPLDELLKVIKEKEITLPANNDDKSRPPRNQQPIFISSTEGEISWGIIISGLALIVSLLNLFF